MPAARSWRISSFPPAVSSRSTASPGKQRASDGLARSRFAGVPVPRNTSSKAVVLTVFELQPRHPWKSQRSIETRRSRARIRSSKRKSAGCPPSSYHSVSAAQAHRSSLRSLREELCQRLGARLAALFADLEGFRAADVVVEAEPPCELGGAAREDHP